MLLLLPSLFLLSVLLLINKKANSPAENGEGSRISSSEISTKVSSREAFILPDSDFYKNNEFVFFAEKNNETPLFLLAKSYEIEVKEVEECTEVIAVGKYVRKNNGYVWRYYVNDEIKRECPENYRLNKGDKVVWKYEKI